MRAVVLSMAGRSEPREVPDPIPGPGEALLDVVACGVCRTDAKAWAEGHKDIRLPRVMGHEVIGSLAGDPGAGLFAPWPGSACGTCLPCRNGRSTICDSMRILGFHRDGGFAERIAVPRSSLVPVPPALDPLTACLAEPAGCAIHALRRVFPPSPAREGARARARIVVFGGGTVGLLAALAAADRGFAPTVIERDEEKIEMAGPFLRATGIACAKETREADFDGAINACAAPEVLPIALSKLRKGGALAYFSGLSKDERIGVQALNLIHYHELDLYGSYGLGRDDLEEGLALLARRAGAASALIEGCLGPGELDSAFPGILAGRHLKYVFLPRAGEARRIEPKAVEPAPTASGFALSDIIASVRPLDLSLRAAALRVIDEKSKPLGSLGALERAGLKLCLIQGSLRPTTDKKALLVFAADHGITEEGVSAYPAEVTAQMVRNFLKGGAAVNSFCELGGIALKIVDVGVKADLAPHPMLAARKVRKGSRNFAVQDAMTREEAWEAVRAGAECALDIIDETGATVLGLGEMGIGNTSSASAIIAAAAVREPEAVAGRGTGVDDKAFARKIEVLRRALDLHKPDPRDGIALLCALGGFEIAAMAGAAMAAASRGVAVVLDGLISSAGGLIASLLCPAAKDYFFAGHRSEELGHRVLLEHLGLEPLLDLGLRLGEGTGAALAMHLLDASCAFIAGMASLEEAGISERI